ncbi:MAG: NAD(+) kinase [Enterovibrio sp.]
MTSHFQTIGLLGLPRNQSALATHKNLYEWLTAQGLQVLVDVRLKNHVDLPSEVFCDLLNMGEQADLAIVIGGDGNMLSAARVLARFDIYVIGVNRGNLGFLTDLDPDKYTIALSDVLKGNFIDDPRFLLEAEVTSLGEFKSRSVALNEVVLHASQVAQMLEFELYIDDDFAFSQRSDGLIIATPTGSTAYSLSGGGPILSPSLDAIALVPMFAHTLSSRPLVVDSKKQLKILVSPQNEHALGVSCDSQLTLPINPGDEITISRSKQQLKLIHPKNYNYYTTLRTKLGWANKLS